MKKMEMMRSISYILLVITISTSPAKHSAYHTESEVYNPVQLMKTRVRFYLHDTLSGTNPSAVRIAGPNATEHTLIPFGSLFAMDDPMTAGPETTSEVVGNARGMRISASRGEDATFVLYADFAFTSGRFEGSSLSLFSRNRIKESRRELAVVGGTGQFKMAAGTVIVTTHFIDDATGDAVLEYNVDVVHAPPPPSPSHGGYGFS